MKTIQKQHQKIIESSKSEETEKSSISVMQKKERRLSAGIYVLIIICNLYDIIYL